MKKKSEKGRKDLRWEQMKEKLKKKSAKEKYTKVTSLKVASSLLYLFVT